MSSARRAADSKAIACPSPHSGAIMAAAQGGLAALARAIRRRLPQTRDRLVGRLKTEGRSNYEIARRVGVTEKAIRKQLKRLGWRTQLPGQPGLALTTGAVDVPAPASPTAGPNLSASGRTPLSLDDDPGNRAMDRLLARAGLIDDAIPLFRPGMGVPRAGVLLAIPALTKTGVFDCAKLVFGDIGPAFYGLRTTVLTLILMALLRIKRPEALKEHAPSNLGRSARP